MDSKQLTRLISGLCVSHVSETSHEIAFHFTNGAILVVEPVEAGFTVALRDSPSDNKGQGDTNRPSPRQREYLEFIKKYTLRFGVSPAESDIQRHFMVSAPSVNQMIKHLERRGFITRDRDFTGQVVPRSLRIVED